MPPLFFFFNATATTSIYTLSLHDALPIFGERRQAALGGDMSGIQACAWKPSPLSSPAVPCFEDCRFPSFRTTLRNGTSPTSRRLDDTHARHTCALAAWRVPCRQPGRGRGHLRRLTVPGGERARVEGGHLPGDPRPVPDHPGRRRCRAAGGLDPGRARRLPRERLERSRAARRGADP